jgi:WD40 repeat protein
LLDQVRDRHPQVGLYILDACRDNPFVDGKGRGIGGTRGLARVEPPSGTFIMFSAGAKESALDRLSDNDPNPNSVYTRTLLPRLKASGRITDIARDVRREVRELAASVAHVQTPAYYDEVVGDFCPAGCAASTAAAQPRATEAPPPQAEAKPAEAPAAPSSPPVETAAALTPQSVQGPAAATRAPILDCDRLAADPNNPDSVVRDRDFEDVDHVKAVPACEEAARLYPQERRFAFQLARAHLFARQFDVAKPRLEALSRDGYAIATTYLGIALADSKKGSLEGDAWAQTEAFRLIRQSADAGDALGAFFLAQFYAQGLGVAKDEAEALRWVRKAADAGSSMAMAYLAEQHETGKLGLTKSDAEAVTWLRKAADLGSTPSLYRLALMYREGLGVPRDETEAARLIQQADDRKKPKAMIDVGRRYGDGSGVAEDKAEALRWYRKAADLGDSSGMFYVGLMYRYGQGIAKDSAEAARWYRKAAELGDTTAMTGLAEMYAAGEGVLADAAEAARWRDAAKTGSAPTGTPAPSAEDSNADAKVATASPNESPAASGAAREDLVRSIGPTEHEFVSLVFSPSGGQLLALASGGLFMHLDPVRGAIGRRLGDATSERPCCQLVISPDGKRVASGSFSNLAMLWDAESGELVRSFKGHTDHVVVVALSPEGRVLASGSHDQTIKLWDVESGKLLRSLTGNDGEVASVSFSPDGGTLASGFNSGAVKLWDVASGKLLKTFKNNNYSVDGLAFSPDGTLLAAKAYFEMVLWNVANGQVLHTLQGEPDPLIFNCMAISPDGTKLASGDFEHSVRLWDVATGTLLKNFEGHAEGVRAVAFSPDGEMLASASGDKTIKLWDMGGAKAAAR